MEALCFGMGTLFAYTHHYYLLIGLTCFYYLRPHYSLVLFFLVGLMLVLGHEWLVKPQGMPSSLIITDAHIKGEIVSIPKQDKNSASFIFSVHQLNQKKAKALIQLTWYAPHPQVHAGETWQFRVKIKRPRSFANPGSYDYVRQLSTKHIFWTGYIRNKDNKLLGQPPVYHWLSFREHLINRLAQLAPDVRSAGIIQALTMNHTNLITQEDWTLFRRTGTTHLFGISGEHIALLSGLFFFIARTIWSQSATCCLLIPAQVLASIVSVLIALLYALLAGFAPPVQRALIGCFLYALSYLSNQKFTPWQVWRYALIGVLLIEPHAVFLQGFYFSFFAVACLLLTHQRWKFKGYKSHIVLQLSCLIGLMPFSLYWFSYCSINGFIANLFAIPLVGLLIVPLSLLVLCFNSFSWVWVLTKPLAWLINLLFIYLNWTEHCAGINIEQALPSIISLFFLLAGLLVWLLFPIKPFRFIALLWIMLAFYPPKRLLNPGDLLVQVLDVGQGLAVHIQTQQHILLYDTGDQFFNGSDLGTMVVVPFYQYFGVKKLDMVVISHPDKDHAGGLASIEQRVHVQKLLVNDPHYYHRGINCHHYPEWEWDKVHFRFLPILAPFKSKNNQSCILQVSTGSKSILLAGDIEKEAEEYLVKTYGEQLKSTVLLIPHHGSKTSSSYRFILEVAPQYAIASLGFANRFHFPNQKTIDTLTRLKIPLYRTDETGMIEVLLPAEGDPYVSKTLG